MPTRKLSEREKLTMFARTATDEQLDQAYEIIDIERRIRRNAGVKAKVVKKATKPTPLTPPKQAEDNSQG